MRSALANIAMAGACTGILCACEPSPRYDACRDCNVVVISVDTLRADHVGALGYPKPTTPEIDALAERGVLFENAISQSSWTRPAHMSIFTGLHPREHGFVALADSRRLDDSIPTLASVLRENGYNTAAFTGGVNMAATYGFDRGFDLYRTNGKYFRDNLEDTRYWLDHERKGKFFLFVHGYDPHTPYLTDPVDRQALALPPLPPTEPFGAVCRGEGPVSRIEPFVREYDGAVHRADRYVGKIVRELGQRGLLDRTIVVVLSDHGEEFLEHGRCFHIATLYREVLHVPLLIVAPGLAPRRVTPPVAASVTIAPTIMEMLGVEHPFRGPSLLGAATGGDVPDDPIVSETERNAEKKGDGHVRALTTPAQKLIQWTTESRASLYDTSADAMEQRPLADAARQNALATELDRWAEVHGPRAESRRRAGAAKGRKKDGDKGGADETPEDPAAERERRQREEELRSLGYAD
jgi:arylsulfatase A-like enzyme